MRNPIANPDQFAAEQDVRAMLALPVVTKARAQSAMMWRIAHGQEVPVEAEPHFEAAMDEYVANYLFKAATCDPAQPRFVRNFMAPYHWNGADVPGARMGGDNPDNTYRLAAIAHGGRYRLVARPAGTEPAHASFVLVGNWGTSVSIATTELHRLVRGADGGAIITIDDQPANGRPNHLTTAPHVKFLFVRDSMMDWATESPLDLAIERLDTPTAAPLSLEECAERAAFRLIEEVPLYFWFSRLSSGQPINRVTTPVKTANLGGLVTQATSISRLQLRPDKAAIYRFDPAGAAYCSLSLLGWWYHSIDAGARQSSLTAAMASANSDGSITCVVSARDPGIHNWIDNGGFEHVMPLNRWQGLPTAELRDGPVAECQIVDFDQLEDALAPEIDRIDATARVAQLAARIASYDRRISL